MSNTVNILMPRYSLLRPLVALIAEGLRVIAKRVRAMWRQRKLFVGEDVNVWSDVECVGCGSVSLLAGVRIYGGTIFRTDMGASIEIGEESVLEKGCVLEARAGQHIRIGKRCHLGERVRIVSVAGVDLGDDVEIGSDATLAPREVGGNGRLLVGNRVGFQQGSIFDLSGDIYVGNDVHSGPNCVCYTHNHLPRLGKLIWDEGIRISPIRIEAGVWIGHGCTFLPGATVGVGAVVAAAAVVTGAVLPNTIVGGVPARFLADVQSSTET